MVYNVFNKKHELILLSQLKNCGLLWYFDFKWLNISTASGIHNASETVHTSSDDAVVSEMTFSYCWFELLYSIYWLMNACLVNINVLL